MLEPHTIETGQQLHDRLVQRSQMRCLHLVFARQLLDQQLAVRAKVHTTGAELGGAAEPFERGGVLGDVVGSLADPFCYLGDDLPVFIDDLDADARRPGIAACRAVAADDQKTRIRRQCSHLLTPSTRLSLSSSMAESCS